MKLIIENLVVRVALVLLAAAETADADAEREVRGRVVDENGKPVAGADVSYWWRANGSPSDRNGRLFDGTPEGQKAFTEFLKTAEGQRAFWGNVGKMFPWGSKPTKSGPDGRFSLYVRETVHHVMAMEKSGTRGGLGILPKGNEKAEIEIRLVPLVRLKGSIEGPGAGERPEWIHVYALLPDDSTRPLDSTQLVGCGSFEARFEMSLPPARYVLNAYSFKGDNDEEKAKVNPDVDVLLTGETPEVDLGVLHLSRFQSTIRVKKQESKAAGTWGDYTKHYGEKPPPWHVVDARGVKKDVQISDFKGKWVLVDFWGPSCVPCMRRGIPKLIKFYEDHEAERDRFEILAICIDEDGGSKSISDLDKKLQPIVEHVWRKPLPFPVLLDPTFTTWERYGLPGLGTVILIDPQGNLVEGDEIVLAEKLKQR